MVKIPWGIVRKKITPPPPVTESNPGEVKVELVELFDSGNSISAGTYDSLFDWRVPEGYAAEVVGFGVIPDYDPVNDTSYLYYAKWAAEDEPFWPPIDCKALTRHGMCIFSFGAAASKKPLFTFGPVASRLSYTLKFNSREKISLHLYADPSNNVTEDYYARARIILYNDAALKTYFGPDINVSNFASLPGGHDQGSVKKYLFVDFAFNSATEGKGKWETLYERELKDYETLRVTKIGVIGHENAKYLRLYDTKARLPIPHREYGWIIQEPTNMLPFGDQDQILGPVSIPSMFVRNYNYTTFQVQIQDNNAVVPANSVVVILLGEYTRMG